MARPPDSDDEGTDVNVDVRDSAITPALDRTAPEMTPAEREPQTLERMSEDPGPVRVGSLGNVGSERSPTRGLRAELGSSPEITESRSMSMITPQFDANRLVSSERGHAGTVDAHKPELEAALSAEEEPDTIERSQAIHDEERTLDREEEPTLDPPGDPGSDDGEEPTSKVQQSDLLLKEAPQLPPIRPMLDSECAGEWPPWQAQSEDVRSALRGLALPISTDTVPLSRATIEEAIGPHLRMQTELAGSEQQRVGPIGPGATQPIDLAALPRVAATEPSNFPSSFVESPARVTTDASSNATHAGSKRAPPRPSISPTTVFIVSFLVGVGLLGGVVAAHRAGWFTLLRAKATTPPATAPAPSISPSESASAPAASATASAAASGRAAPSASSSVPAASASETKPKGKPSSAPSSHGPRPRGAGKPQ